MSWPYVNSKTMKNLPEAILLCVLQDQADAFLDVFPITGEREREIEKENHYIHTTLKFTLSSNTFSLKTIKTYNTQQ